MVSSLVGGIFYIKGKHTPPPEEFDPTTEDNESISGEEDFVGSAEAIATELF